MSQTYPPAQGLRDLLYLFPHVENDTIVSIIHHDLHGTDIYRLDSRRILESQWDLVEASLEDRTCATSVAVDIYRTLDSLLVPLNAYFSILSLHGLAHGQPAMLPCYFFRYNSHLVKLASQYEWPAVLSYHLAFFDRRCKEMRLGDYSGWGKVDVQLMEEFLVPYQKTSKSRKNGRIR
ncbi:hypothetical protein SCP_0207610 [Sparassis crispa]|uniref:Uncharacterized protein n=1 Tax=Sparassis crispa TaxID=139825 RepID=A0A401GBN7_9APHY|nr:hypothetical protein SCP_0207610 [Sparassis crispa]GBE79561.1 hypothetical protein SCP_0207610 [Sparassis crispa]